ncbi:porphobilinogen synthase [Croceimicrobium hydrocarbonivorans]|uniref:Delta-aminolevulinic acid dehydratase n=1 Tax=Croceimicrobium hydrocarbonivorans TaxID=2761580 RepID=A0A7H0VJV4_9FLAO|nr:porphobilinogen synthase [Croceimicrobium hydrocarbonivorans]QNR26002.1 porphobilinogen synthase [Croceimicrobium hydrocarbonivorans]
MSMLQRPRRLRQSAAIRGIAQETHLHPSDFIAPLFAVEGEGIKSEISSMPGYFRYSLDLLQQEVLDLQALGCTALLLFVKVPDHLKDNEGEEAVNPDGLMQQAIRMIKETAPDMLLMTDVALDPYSSLGHDGIVEDGEILNDESVGALAEMAVSHAQAGADFVAPSDMMDGRIEAMRIALDTSGFQNVGIMSYSAKYASCFYGPFRDALDSAPVDMENVPRDKKTYQMNPANAIEAKREVELDLLEGADMVMVKPAMAYLDIIRQTKEISTVPVSAYHVSGEYAMIKAAAANGWLNEEEAMVESLTAIKRAGADLIATYFVRDILKYLRNA